MTLEREDWMPSEMPASRAACQVHCQTEQMEEEDASVYRYNIT